MAAGRKLAVTAACFAVAAALSSWHPLAAPFGLVVGLAALLNSIRAFRLGGRRAVAGIALVVSVLAVAGSGLVLALTAGVGREPAGQLVSGASREEAARTLDQEEERTRAARERARQELGKVGGAPPPATPERPATSR
ncbi:MAG TPA: hypothetical protein VLQ79_03375 [Myxococcaceae bacterium]|nr:hypothetical protein [Myxococcaceae bacterium]